MKRAAFFVVLLAVVAVLCAPAFAGCGSCGAADTDEGGWEEMEEMNTDMDVQPGEETSIIEEQGSMDVQPEDAIDSEGTGAH